MLILLVGCGEAVEDIPVKSKPAATTAAEPVAEAEKAAGEAVDEAEPVEEYRYNPAGKRDPFQSFVARQQSSQAISPDAPPLVRYPVDKFTLTGVISESAGSAALLVDPEGLGHVVRLGTYVGKNWGKVTSITGAGVVVTEEYHDIEGNLIVNPVTLRFSGKTE